MLTSEFILRCGAVSANAQWFIIVVQLFYKFQKQKIEYLITKARKYVEVEVKTTFLFHYKFIGLYFYSLPLG
jgi:hypothetical protein